MSRAKSGFLALLRETQGNVLPLAAVGLLLSAALVGGGIDMSRAYRVQNRLQSACDSAVLAGRRAVGSNGFDTTAKNKAISYFQTNFDQGTLEASNTSRDFTSPDNGQTVAGTASTELNLAVMKIFGFQKFSLAVTCQASMGVGNSDVVMVLDTTGSMNSSLGSGTRISALRTAMKNFYTTVKTATTGTNARIRYGFVPYSSSVNVGNLLYSLNPTYLRDTYTIQSRQMSDPVVTTSTSGTWDNGWSLYSSNNYGSSNSCNNAIPSDTPWTNVGNSSSSTNNSTNNGIQTSVQTVTQQQTRRDYQCYYYYGRYYPIQRDEFRNQYTYNTRTMQYKPVTYDVTSYKAGNTVTTNTGSYGGVVSSSWAGCIEERGSVAASSFSYSSTTGMSPSGAWDLDIDSAPTSNVITKWAPMWPQVAYIREDQWGNRTQTSPSNYGDDVNSYCPNQSQLLTELTQTEFNTYADALSAQGSTYLDIGMVWGGRLSSPTGIFSSNVNVAPTNGGEVSRHIIFMTDGIMEPNFTIQSAWGIEYHDQRVTSDGSSNDASRHTSRFLALCEAIKAKGIRVWTIAFTNGGSSDLQTCASADSYFNANDATALNEAFQEIAKQVGELRIIQ